jgi:hypothetical protein
MAISFVFEKLKFRKKETIKIQEKREYHGTHFLDKPNNT